MATTYQNAVPLPRDAYSNVSIALHWTIAAMMFGSVTSGVLSNHVDEATAAGIMTTHKPAGLTILALSLIRLGWRLAHRIPDLPASTPRWNALVARATHVALYALMVGVPFAGWVAASRRGGEGLPRRRHALQGRVGVP
uniref:cytochrome b n=1 Tax=uncultured Sphingomonas sp. TaxID=158754 RepID=UPI0025DF97F5